MNDQEGYNVKDIIKRNIKSARSDASRLKRPRGPEGKPPEMGPNFMQKRQNVANSLKASRKELARQTENFITRTVGMLFDRLDELSQATMKSAARKAQAKAKAFSGASVAARKAGSHGAATNFADAAARRTSQARRIKAGAEERAASPAVPPTKPSSRPARVRRGNRQVNKAGRKAERELASHQNFIGRTVEVLSERIMANKAKKNAWMASQPTNPDNERKIPKQHKAEAGEDTAGSVQFNAVRRSQYNVPKHSKVTQGAGDEGKPFDDKSKLTAARTVQKNTPSPFMSAVNARKARVNKAYQAKRDRDLASHQNFIGKAVEILAERLVGNQKKLDVNKSGKLDAQDFKMLRAGKKKDK